MIDRQPTGIFDKHGIEIYTGDILYDPSWWWGTRYVYLNRGDCGPAKGDSVMAYILASDIDNPLEKATYNIWNGHEVEIIGRIDETPELLNIKSRDPLPALGRFWKAASCEDWPDTLDGNARLSRQEN